MATATTPPPKHLETRSHDPKERSADAQYLHERGWVDNKDGTWLDMSPPGDRIVEVNRIKERDGITERVVNQVMAGPPPGWAYPLATALAEERKRNREVPLYHVVLSRSPSYDDGRDAQWQARDRWKRLASPPFPTKAEAEAWIEKQPKE